MSSESDGNDSDAFYYFKRSADLGYSPAQASLGLYYLRGKCVNKDKEKALEYLKKSAKQGNRSAQHYIFLYNVITIIEDATGPQKDYIPAEAKVKMFDDVFRSARELAAQDNEVAQVLTFVLCAYEDKILEELKKEVAK